MGSRLWFIGSGFTALLLCLFALTIFLWHYHTPKIAIRPKTSALEVTLTMPEPPKPSIQPPKPQSKVLKPTTPKKPAKSEQSTKAAKPTLNDLFDDLNITHTPKRNVKLKNMERATSRNPSEYTAAITNEQRTFKSQKIQLGIKVEKSPSKTTQEASEGIEDAYFTAVYEVLAENWVPLPTDGGKYGLVRLEIGLEGGFSYQLLRFTPDESFIQRLKQHLDSIRQRGGFPKPKRAMVLEVNFFAKND